MNIPDFEIELKLLQRRSAARIAVSFAVLQIRDGLALTYWGWRMNEQEAVVHSRYLEQFTQYLIPKFGERRNAGEGLLCNSRERFPSTSKRFPNYDGMMYE